MWSDCKSKTGLELSYKQLYKSNFSGVQSSELFTLDVASNPACMTNYYEYAKSHPEIYKQFSCKDLLLLLCECPPEIEKSKDWSHYNALSYVLSGQVKLHSRERSWHLHYGDSVFMKKGVWGVEKIEYDSFCSLLFYIPDAFIRAFVREHISRFSHTDQSLLSSIPALPVESNMVLAAFYESVASYFMTGTQPDEELLELKFRELLLNIVTNPANSELRAYFYKVAMTDKDDLQDVMERNCLYHLQPREYAKLCHRSLSSYKRDFHEAYGISPGRWLLGKRLLHAARLLKQTSLPVSDITLDCGFKNVAHFDRVFKKRFEISPLQYRKQQLGRLTPLS